MIFASYTYALFLIVVFALHWLLPPRARPWLLIAASYFFYATWRWPYVGLLLAVTLFNWAYARFALAAERPLWPGLLVNVTVLAYFKYASFLIDNVAGAVRLLGVDWYPHIPDIMLPLGVSFFIFQGIAYLVDVAAGEKPFARPRDFLLYKAFWPQLIAGPIIRPSEIRDQIDRPRTLNYDNVSIGVRRILRGVFKKVVLADTLGAQVDLAFLTQGSPHAVDTLVGVLGFGFQIYFDFSAYSDFAIGSARLFGFEFPENFSWPYAARSPQEFWNRWHMTLSRWIRDYVFSPLAFATRRQPSLRPLALITAMGLCGLWHGAAWTFVLWGLWHGVFLVVQATVLRNVFDAEGRGAQALARVFTLFVVFGGWLLFRAPSLASAVDHLNGLVTLRGGVRPAMIRENGALIVMLIVLGSMAVSLNHARLEAWWEKWNAERALRPWLRPTLYACLLCAAIVLDREATAFVYFQF
jgi:alginate O-acetyltransferase complex protein AlgI